MKKLVAVIVSVVAVLLFVTGCSNQTDRCSECGGSYKLTNHTRLTSDHKEAHDYYYYTYECVECGHEYTLEIVK